MAQLTSFLPSTDGSAADISAGLPRGEYIGQVLRDGRGLDSDAPRVLYATAPTAPVRLRDYFEGSAGDTFRFCAGEGQDPTWVRRAPAAELYGTDYRPAVARTRFEAE